MPGWSPAASSARWSGQAQWCPTHGNSGVVEHLAHVVGMHAVDDEGNGTPARSAPPRADDADPWALGESGQQPVDEHGLVVADALDADPLDPADGSSETDGPAALGTPASNFCGAGAHVDRSMVTSSIIDPPVRKGGMTSSSSA